MCRIRSDTHFFSATALAESDANHASGLDEALPGLWTTEDRRVPSGGPESNWYEPGKKIAPRRLRIPDRWAMGSHPRRNFENIWPGEGILHTSARVSDPASSSMPAAPPSRRT